MRHVCLLTLIVPLFLLGACAPTNDVPRYTADEVITVAKSFRPDCRVQVGFEMTSP